MMLCSNCQSLIIPVVAVDIDGTLGDFHAHFLNFASNYLGRDVPHTYKGKPGFKVWFRQQTDVDDRTWHDIKLAYRQGAQKRSMPVYDGAARLCRTVQSLGAELWLTTTRPYMRLDNVDPDSRAWLARHNIPYDGLLYDEDKYARLAEYVDPHRVVAILDDLPEQWSAAAEHFGWKVPILRRTKWNTAIPCEQTVVTLNSATTLISNRIREWEDEHVSR